MTCFTLKRSLILICCGLLAAVVVSVASFMIQAANIRGRVELTRQRGKILFICRFPAETAAIHGALTFAACSGTTALMMALAKRKRLSWRSAS